MDPSKLGLRGLRDLTRLFTVKGGTYRVHKVASKWTSKWKPFRPPSNRRPLSPKDVPHKTKIVPARPTGHGEQQSPSPLLACALALANSPANAQPGATPATPENSESARSSATSSLNSTTAHPPTADEICRALEQSAAENALPVEFFARVIWQESRFDAQAVSPKGPKVLRNSCRERLALLWQIFSVTGFPYVERPRGQGTFFIADPIQERCAHMWNDPAVKCFASAFITTLDCMSAITLLFVAPPMRVVHDTIGIPITGARHLLNLSRNEIRTHRQSRTGLPADRRETPRSSVIRRSCG